jgi:cytochrome c-type biogenesis protein CcmH/NrfG
MRNRDYRLAITAWEKVLKVYPDNQSTLDNIEQARLRLSAEETDN